MPTSLNPYQYGFNNPHVYPDPTGEWPDYLPEPPNLSLPQINIPNLYYLTSKVGKGFSATGQHALSAIGIGIDGVHNGAKGLNRATSELARTLRQGSSYAGKNLKKVAKLKNHSIVQTLLKADKITLITSGTVTFIDNKTNGKGTVESLIRAGGATGGSALGAGLGGIACSAIAASSAGVGAGSCIILIPGGAIAGGEGGEWVAGEIYNQTVKKR